jgi:hypothetical protein
MSRFMKNYILHIGLPKTGTTALQRNFFSRLEHPSICYNPPCIIGPLIEALKLLDFGFLGYKDMELLKKVIDRLASAISQENILISFEGLSQRLMRIDFPARAQFLKSLFPNATIAMVFRYQPTLLKSLYQQHVKQNYFLMPDDVFVPYSEYSFADEERWKECMKIDVRQWDYAEAIRIFTNCFQDKFCFLFYENHSRNLLSLGESILDFAGLNSSGLFPTGKLPRTNVSYDATTMSILLALARRGLAFRSNTGFYSRHIRDLLEQAAYARFVFDANGVKDFLVRLENRERISRSTYTFSDKVALQYVRKVGNLCHRVRKRPFELPEKIATYLQCESKILNSSLCGVVDRNEIPNCYMPLGFNPAQYDAVSK